MNGESLKFKNKAIRSVVDYVKKDLELDDEDEVRCNVYRVELNVSDKVWHCEVFEDFPQYGNVYEVHYSIERNVIEIFNFDRHIPVLCIINNVTLEG